MASTAQIIRALMSGDRFALIIALDPEAADVIPRGPLRSEFTGVSLGAEVALNPQPLPPAGLVVGARLMHRLTAAALASGKGFGGQFAEDIDDWCGTGWPRRWPKSGPVVGPELDPWVVAQILLGGLLAATEISAHYDDPRVVGAFDKGHRLPRRGCRQPVRRLNASTGSAAERPSTGSAAQRPSRRARSSACSGGRPEGAEPAAEVHRATDSRPQLPDTPKTGTTALSGRDSTRIP